jgi:hypothetical protein
MRPPWRPTNGEMRLAAHRIALCAHEESDHSRYTIVASLGLGGKPP